MSSSSSSSATSSYLPMRLHLATSSGPAGTQRTVITSGNVLSAFAREWSRDQAPTQPDPPEKLLEQNQALKKQLAMAKSQLSTARQELAACQAVMSNQITPVALYQVLKKWRGQDAGANEPQQFVDKLAKEQLDELFLALDEAKSITGRALEQCAQCKICFERKANVVLDPCGHISMCDECSESHSKGKTAGQKMCPFCKRVYTKAFRAVLV